MVVSVLKSCIFCVSVPVSPMRRTPESMDILVFLIAASVVSTSMLYGPGVKTMLGVPMFVML